MTNTSPVTTRDQELLDYLEHYSALCEGGEPVLVPEEWQPRLNSLLRRVTGNIVGVRPIDRPIHTYRGRDIQYV